jgi:hypothetical protein
MFRILIVNTVLLASKPMHLAGIRKVLAIPSSVIVISLGLYGILTEESNSQYISKPFHCPVRLFMSQALRFALILRNLGQLTDNIPVLFNIFKLSHKNEACFIHCRPTRSVFERLV